MAPKKAASKKLRESGVHSPQDSMKILPNSKNVKKRKNKKNLNKSTNKRKKVKHKETVIDESFIDIENISPIKLYLDSYVESGYEDWTPIQAGYGRKPSTLCTGGRQNATKNKVNKRKKVKVNKNLKKFYDRILSNNKNQNCDLNIAFIENSSKIEESLVNTKTPLTGKKFVAEKNFEHQKKRKNNKNLNKSTNKRKKVKFKETVIDESFIDIENISPIKLYLDSYVESGYEDWTPIQAGYGRKPSTFCTGERQNATKNKVNKRKRVKVNKNLKKFYDRILSNNKSQNCDLNIAFIENSSKIEESSVIAKTPLTGKKFVVEKNFEHQEKAPVTKRKSKARKEPKSKKKRCT
uniref:Uncharacterized protein n=1 Tax=Strongyloides stercoralis TaxID=6248 RepID=A0A0K0EFP7_STRER